MHTKRHTHTHTHTHTITHTRTHPQGYVAEGIDLGPTFDPEDVTDHRYQYVVTDTDVAIMPTLDYYG